MIRKISWIILLVLATSGLNAGQGGKTDRLARFGRFWGFLKYYHPVAAASTHWDSTCSAWIPKVEKQQTSIEFDELLRTFYRQLPPAKLSGTLTMELNDSTRWIFTESDIHAIGLPPDMQAECSSLLLYHLPDTSRYVTNWYKQYQLDFIYHTEVSDDNPFPAESERLLALFRYWNTIEFFYPHKDRMKDWGHVLRAYIPRFMEVVDAAGYRRLTLELIHELPDAHSFLREESYDKRYQFSIPLKLVYLEGRYIVGSVVPGRSELQRGDEILSVNNAGVKTRERELKKIVTGTNPASLYRNIAQELLRTGDTIVRVEIRRGDERLKKVVRLYRNGGQTPGVAKKLWEEVRAGVWYVRFCDIASVDTLASLFTSIRNAKAVIWEMRGYPNFDVTVAIQKYLFRTGTWLADEWNAVAAFPGKLRRVRSITREEIDSQLFYKGPMIVLVDEQTQSLAESVAASLRTRPGCLVMGSQTAGTTGNITWLGLPGNMLVSYTGVAVEGAGNSFRQGDGVWIDRRIPATREKFLQSGDHVLDEAIRYAANLNHKK